MRFAIICRPAPEDGWDDVTEKEVNALAIVSKADAKAWLDEEGTPAPSRGSGEGEGGPLLHRVSHCALTAEEASFAKKSSPVGVEGWLDVFVITPILITGAFFLVGMVAGVVLAWAARAVGGPDSGSIVAVALIAASAVGLAVSIRAVRDMRRARLAARRDLRGELVEVIAVQRARIVQREEYNDEGPLYYCGIGDGKVLFLGGRWLFDDATYGRDPDAAPDNEDDWPPFPALSFTAHRLPSSGHVLRLEISGERVAPEAVLSNKSVLPSWLRDASGTGLAQSFVCDGDIAELVRLARAAKGAVQRAGGGA